jgi:AcrR family transcriptional regulator
MATIKFVGPKPIVSDKGVRFDASKPDKYIYLGAALQLAQAFDVEGEAKDIIYRAKTSELSETQINDLLQKYCGDIEETVKEREEKAKGMVEELRQRVNEAKALSEDARRAWLKNIEAMYEYYLQYVTNEAAYDCVLERIASEVAEHHIQEIRVPLLNHFGMVLHELSQVLENRRPPIDSEYHVEQTPEGLFAVMKLRYA